MGNINPRMNFTPEERESYEDHLKWLRIESNTLKKAEEKGREEGRNERSIEIARNMLNAGLSNDQISKLTSLTEKEIKSLQN